MSHANPDHPGPQSDLKSVEKNAPRQSISQWLTERIAAIQQRAPAAIDPDSSFNDLGVDSLKLMMLSAQLGTWLRRPVDPVMLYSHPTIHALAAHLSSTAPSDDQSQQSVIPAEPIAVIGLACRFPKADSSDEYWALLDGSIDAISEIPSSRWNAEALYQAGPPTPGKSNTKWGGFLDGVDCFDAHFFGISPREAAGMDPQQRLLLQTSWHALEDAGILPDSLAGSDAGVFIGAMTHDYELLELSRNATLDAYFGTGTNASILANRISYLFDLRGPSWVAETACSSSLVALHSARLSLQTRECTVALVGSVNCMLTPELYVALSQAQMLSPDGRCMSFDARANGYVRSEGCAVLILKRHDDAVRDNDRIYGVIRGTAVNQDGRSNGMTAPNGDAQQAVIRKALAIAGLEASDISYVEAHGTGTSLGDPIEVDALKRTYGVPSGAQSTLWIGSSKTHIGHTEPVSGLAGLIKVLLAMQHERLPGNLHFKELNPQIDLRGSRCAILSASQSWPRQSTTRMAAVSSFGFGGANAHVIVAEPVFENTPRSQSARPHILTVSAKTPAALQRRLSQWSTLLANDRRLEAPTAFQALCHTANAHRAQLKHRIAIVARGSQEAAKALLEHASQGDTAAHELTAGGRTAFLFTGQGSQYSGMGRELYEGHAFFRVCMDQCDDLLRPHLQGRSLVQGLYGNEHERFNLNETQFAQPALFSVEWSLAALWRSAGITPDCMIGHSLGEYVAACIAGVFNLSDALKLVAHRGRLMQQATPQGLMVALHGDTQCVQRCIDDLEAAGSVDVAVAARNTHSNAVVSGHPESVQHWIGKWQRQWPDGRLNATTLQVDRAFHSPIMAAMLEEFGTIASQVEYHRPCIELISNVTGESIDAAIADPAYWVDHVLKPVAFLHGLQTLASQGCTTFVEVGPHPVLTAFGREAIGRGTWLGSLRRGRDAEEELLSNLGQWHVQGGSIDWKGWARARAGDSALPRPLSLPPYPFEPDTHWFKPGSPVFHQSPVHPLIGSPLPLALPEERRFQAQIATRHPWFIDEHRAFNVPVVPMAAFIEASLAAVRHHVVDTLPHWSIEDMALHGALAIPENHEAELQYIVTGSGGSRPHRVSVKARTRQVDLAAGWSAWRDIASARVAVARRHRPSSIKPLDLQQRLVEQSVEDLYVRAAAVGLVYGSGLQGVKRLWLGGHEALARVDMPPRTDEDSTYLLHPATLDACFHVAIPFMEQALAGRPLALLPTAVSGITVRRRLPSTSWVHATWHGETVPGRYVADLNIYGDDGDCIVSVSGMQLALGSAHSITSAPPGDAVRYYRMEWIPFAPRHTNLHVPAVNLAESRPWLIACPNDDLARAIHDRTVAAGHQAAVVTATVPAGSDATAHAATGESDVDWQRLFAEMRNRHGQFAGLIYHGGEPTGHATDVPAESEWRANTVLHVCKQFLLACGEQRPDVVILTRGALLPPEGVLLGHGMETAGLVQSAECAMAKAITPEFPGVRTLQFDLDPAAAVDNLPLVKMFEILGAAEGSGLWAVRGDRCFEARLRELSDAKLQTNDVAIDQDATYLVTGGLRGIGLATAQWLANLGARSIALLGRHSDATSEAAVRDIESRGARVRCFIADVSDRDALARVLAAVRSSMPPLRGVFHSAGVTDDAALGVMEWSRVAKVLAPKVRGAWNLHELTLDQDLDYFVLYSSLASLVGNAGQFNHITACSFLDALSAYRRHVGLPGLSINWGYWSEIGVATRYDLDSRMERLGVGGITTTQGLHALHRLTAASLVQCGAMIVDWSRLKPTMYPEVANGLLAELGEQRRANPGVEESAWPTFELGTGLLDLPLEEAKHRILAYLLCLAGRILKLGPDARSEIERGFANTALNQLGFDSLMAVEMRNRIRADSSADVPLKHFLAGSSASDVADLILAQSVVSRMEPSSSAAGGDLETLTL